MPVTQKVPQHRLGAVQRIQQPEQRDIGHGKISHPFIALATHGHQARQTSPKLSKQLFKLRRQPAAALDLQQRREKRLVDKPGPLRVPLQANKRTGQVIAVVLMGETEGQLRLHDGNLSGIFPELVADIAPVLPEAHRPFGHLLRLQAVAAIRLHQGQRQHDHRLAVRAVQ